MRAKREAKIFLDYLREPSGQANFFYTTSASLPGGTIASLSNHAADTMLPPLQQTAHANVQKAFFQNVHASAAKRPC